MKKLLLKISPTFLIIFYRSIKSQVVNLIVRNTPRGNKDEYLKLYNQSLTREYPIIEEFLKNKIRDDDFINELALTTQISIKGSEPNFQHGKIIYALLGIFGGFLFALTYSKTKSLLLVSFEHALYGNTLFFLGLGWFFWGGSVGN